MVFCHVVNPLSEWLYIPSVWSSCAAHRQEWERFSTAGWTESSLHFHFCSASCSFPCFQKNSGSCPAVSLSFLSSLSLTDTYLLPPLPLSFFHSAQPLYSATARRGVSTRLLAACGTICQNSFSLCTHTHARTSPCTNTHTCMHLKTRHMNT